MDEKLLANMLFNINVMTLELFAKMLEKCNSFEEFKICLLATLQNLKNLKNEQG